MSQISSNGLKTDSKRLFKDQFAKYGVMTGGVLVLCALLLIFFYLLYVVKPVFNAAHIEPRSSVSTMANKYVAVGIEEQTEIAFGLTDKGMVDFYNVKGSGTGKLITSVDANIDDNIIAFSSSAPHQGQYAYLNEHGEITVIKPSFRVAFPNDVRTLTPVITYPFGEQPTPALDLPAGEARNILSRGEKTNFAFATDENAIGIVYKTANDDVIFSRLESEEDMFTDELSWTSYQSDLNFVTGTIQQLLISPDASRLFVVTDKHIYVANSRDGEDVQLLYTVDVGRNAATITTAKLLAGANSLMVGYSDGYIGQWFETNSADGRAFIQSRHFQMAVDTEDKAVVAIYPEFYRRTFTAVTKSGEANIFHTTSEAELWQGQLVDQAILDFEFSPRSNAIVIYSAKGLSVFKIENEHPEVSWSGLWQEVWYEGYPEADYIWQSSSASDDFESKFSLVPISFGTLKAAMYAMMFAVPIGLAAAVYTAYFMAPSVRKIVKPTVEIMEALPTVILGFLAGLWLAPVIEEHLPGVVLLLILLPLSVFITAFIWHNLPTKVRNKVPAGWDSIILLPIVVIVGWTSFALSPLVELWLFNGNTRLFITNDLGITFDQRNSLIVGIAMGFAVIPTIFSIAEDAVFSVPKTLSSGSLALGATQWQTLVKVVLLTASPGIFSAVMMGLGRAVGETMIVLMATGNTPIMDWSIFEGMRTLSANIAVEMPESEVGSSHYRILFLAAFVLFIFTFFFNTIAEFVRQRLREKYSSL
ncbi:ABC transporter permease subunit [Psychrosphaera sp. B3R10]|uniref:ABC transporter permease subunit n=1 Tax=Psychrosphaera sp. I2R16 TaxID=2841558 RepID=UPI001C08D6C3|nr:MULTISPECIES: ABC transporter permease subunit [unclassified Psychrosphaera]MBU2882916.1 ABC transporter permease subunit [Psychrosphaera sp. I2R16]MBU2991313.1 ABC transporter permease subunit [Psychrosphaera sp. B3R10]